MWADGTLAQWNETACHSKIFLLMAKYTAQDIWTKH